MRQAITDTDLHAYADGQLSPEQRLEVETFLAQNPEATRRVAAYAEQNRILREVFGPVLAEPADERLEQAATQLRQRLRVPANDNRWLEVAWRSAAAAVLLLAGGAIGYRLHSPEPAERLAYAESFAEQAIQAHELVTSEPNQHTTNDLHRVNQSVAAQVGNSVNEPDLSQFGFRFVGARTGAGAAGPFGQYVYRNDQGREITLFVGKRDGPHGGFKLGHDGDATALYWSQGPVAYALMGSVPRDQLVELTRFVNGMRNGQPRPVEQHPNPAQNAVMTQHAAPPPPQDQPNQNAPAPVPPTPDNPSGGI